MHLGFFCHVAPSHVSGMTALAAHLNKRGHRVTLFQVPDVAPAVKRAGLEFRAIGEQQYPPGTIPKLDEEFGKLSGLVGVRYALERTIQYSVTAYTEGPAIIRSAGVDALIVDRAELAGATIAEHLSLPFVSISMGLPITPDYGQPPYFTTWSYRPGVIGKLRNRMGYRAFRRLVKPLFAVDDAQRDAWKLPPRPKHEPFQMQLGEITQLPACLDFPRKALPHFYYTGPFAPGVVRPEVTFPWSRLDGRPLIYAALGTLVPRAETFRTIAEACAGLGVQLVLSLGGGAVKPEELTALPDNPIVVRYAPQVDLIKRSALVITHAGLNTTLESLSYGVPMVAIPFTHDQPGVAARIVWHGAGELISPKRLSVRRLRGAVLQVLSKPSYRKSAQRLQAEITVRDGLRRAGNIIERVFGVKHAVAS